MLVAENLNTFFFKFSNSCGLICFKRPEVTGKKEGFSHLRTSGKGNKSWPYQALLHFSAHFREEALKRPRVSRNLEFASLVKREMRGFNTGSLSGKRKCAVTHITCSFDVVILPQKETSQLTVS